MSCVVKMKGSDCLRSACFNDRYEKQGAVIMRGWVGQSKNLTGPMLHPRSPYRQVTK